MNSFKFEKVTRELNLLFCQACKGNTIMTFPVDDMMWVICKNCKIIETVRMDDWRELAKKYENKV